MRPAGAFELLFMALDWRGRMHMDVRQKKFADFQHLHVPVKAVRVDPHAVEVA